MKKKFIIYSILYVVFVIPGIGLLSKLMGKQFGYFTGDSHVKILTEFVIASVAMACLVGLILVCVGLLSLKDMIAGKIDENRRQ